MTSPRNCPNISTGCNPDVVNNLSICNDQFKICLLDATRQLENAILNNDRRCIIYFMGIITSLKYNNLPPWSPIVPYDMLLLQKKWNYSKRLDDLGKEPRRHCQEKKKVHKIKKRQSTSGLRRQSRRSRRIK